MAIAFSRAHAPKGIFGGRGGGCGWVSSSPILYFKSDLLHPPNRSNPNPPKSRRCWTDLPTAGKLLLLQAWWRATVLLIRRRRWSPDVCLIRDDQHPMMADGRVAPRRIKREGRKSPGGALITTLSKPRRRSYHYSLYLRRLSPSRPSLI